MTRKKPTAPKPRPAADLNDARFDGKCPAAQLARWHAFAAERGMKLSEVIRRAVDAYIEAGENGRLADLGRSFLDLARDYDEPWPAATSREKRSGM